MSLPTLGREYTDAMKPLGLSELVLHHIRKFKPAMFDNQLAALNRQFMSTGNSNRVGAELYVNHLRYFFTLYSVGNVACSVTYHQGGRNSDCHTILGEHLASIRLPARGWLDDDLRDMQITQSEFHQILTELSSGCMYCMKTTEDGNVCNLCLAMWTEPGCALCGQEAGQLERTICDCVFHNKCWVKEFHNKDVLARRRTCEICGQKRKKRARQ